MKHSSKAIFVEERQKQVLDLLILYFERDSSQEEGRDDKAYVDRGRSSTDRAWEEVVSYSFEVGIFDKVVEVDLEP